MKESVLKSAEVLASVAVILSLAVLIYEVRENSNALDRSNSLAKDAAIDRGFEQFSEFRRFLASDRDLTELWLRGSRGEELDEIDSDRFARLVIEWALIRRNNYLRNVTVGNEGIPIRMVEEVANEVTRNPGFYRVWNAFLGSKDPTGFADAVKAELAKRGSTGTN
jgi:hypothetical protein